VRASSSYALSRVLWVVDGIDKELGSGDCLIWLSRQLYKLLYTRLVLVQLSLDNLIHLKREGIDYVLQWLHLEHGFGPDVPVLV
jgi:hypothetical protein